MYVVIFLLFTVTTVSSLLPSSSLRLRLQSKFSLLSSSAKDNAIPVYSGPINIWENMEAGIDISDLNLQVLVGPSAVCDGRGLYIALGDDVEEVTIPRGTPICGYSKGTFTNSANGDKTVAYAFEDIEGIFLL